MKYPLEIEGCEGQDIELDSPGFLKAASLLVDGKVAPKQKQGRFILTRNDGREILARIRPSLFYDAPTVLVEGRTVRALEPLGWYQYVLSMLPVVLLAGGLLGALLAILLIGTNIKIFRSSLGWPLQYTLVLVLSLGVPMAYAVFSISVHTLSR